MKLLANAKINLNLNVVGKRKDEYHNLESIFLPVDLCDEIEIKLLPHGYKDIVRTSIPSLNNEDNIVYKVLKLMAQLFMTNRSFEIYIRKNIPIGAGLGGGTSDAVAIAEAIVDILKLKMTDIKREKLLHAIGADATFFLKNKPSLVTGIGDKVQRIRMKKTYVVLIITPSVGLLTKDVFASYNHKTDLSTSNTGDLIRALESGDMKTIQINTTNALINSATTLAPEITDIISFLKDKLPKAAVSMTGSGSSVFALCSNGMKLKSLANHFTRLGYNAVICQTINN